VGKNRATHTLGPSNESPPQGHGRGIAKVGTVFLYAAICFLCLGKLFIILYTEDA
jgi:hypothetical protein